MSCPFLFLSFSLCLWGSILLCCDPARSEAQNNIMAVTAKWDNPEQNRILISFDRPWTWAEFDAANAGMDKLFRSVSHRVDLILDITNGGLPPGNAMQRFKQVSENRHLNLGKIMV